jgi:cytoskeletal protein CcmA (bactofilin family)
MLVISSGLLQVLKQRVSMSDVITTFGNLYVGEGVVAKGVAIVPNSAEVNGHFDGAIDAKEIEVQAKGVVSGTTQAATIVVSGKVNDIVHATDTLRIGNSGIVSGDIRYGNLEVAKGGELLGSMKQI